MAGNQPGTVVHWSRWRAMLILIIATLLMSACADLITEHIQPILTHPGISQVCTTCTTFSVMLSDIANALATCMHILI